MGQNNSGDAWTGRFREGRRGRFGNGHVVPGFISGTMRTYHVRILRGDGITGRIFAGGLVEGAEWLSRQAKDSTQ